MATLQPGQVTAAGAIGVTGGTAEVDEETGVMTHPDFRFGVKTNGAAPDGTGVETPFPVVGSTIGAQVTRPVVDTKNATNVGVPGGPDPVAPQAGS